MANRTDGDGHDRRRREVRRLLHELNNALNALSMQAQLAELSLQDQDADTASSSLERVRAKCAEAARLSADIQGIVLETENPNPSE